MAEIIIQRVGGIEWKDINVTASVGRGGANMRDDVMVVQALMKYGLERIPEFGRASFPMPNGVVDAKMIANIEKYQRYVRRKQNTRVSVDGRIDPARGMTAGRRGVLAWTIQRLNLEAEQTYRSNTNDYGLEDRYIEEMCRQFPQVDAILSGTAVGTLNLGLA